MPYLRANLLGGLEFQDAKGGELKLSTRKTRALLAFLIAESDKWHTRDRLAGLLWSDRQQAQARHSLTQALGTVRKLAQQIGVDLLSTDADRIRLEASVVRSDLLAFRETADAEPIIASEHYNGPLLEGFASGDPAFEEWADLERAALHRQACVVIEAAAKNCADNGDVAAAHVLASKWVALEPLSEAAHRQVMRVAMIKGDRAGAIRQFQTCAQRLRDELDVEPSPETAELFAEIRSGDLERELKRALNRLGPAKMNNVAASSGSSVADTENILTTADSIERQNLIETETSSRLPIIAVLPFMNQSDEPDLIFLADGLADDVLFALAGFRWFKVLGRSSTFRLAGKAIDAEQLRAHLGATHLVTGNIRRQGARLRIHVELIDCTTSQQVWSARFDEGMDRIFDVEDEVVSQIASAIVPALEHSEIQSLLNKPPQSLSAYELLQRGNWHLYRNLSTYDADEEATRCYEAALERDPNYATALAALAYVQYRSAYKFIASNFHERIADAKQIAVQALRIDPREPRALRYLGAAESMLGDQEAALHALEQAIELCPSFATAYSGLAFVHDFRGDFEAAKPAADETIRLRPHDPVLHRCVIARSIADYQTGDYREAERIARNSIRTNNEFWMSNAMLASSLSQQGQADEARAVVEHIRHTYPGLKLEQLLTGMPFAQSVHLEHLRDGLAKAGWRDAPD
jgi:TolB-like protein/DNA-binding SARP family transcriptional activator/Flp pilus assembly protein TadD